MVFSGTVRFHQGLLASLFLVGCSGGGGAGNDRGNATGNDAWLIPQDEIADGGPGVDGIPAIESPLFEPAATIGTVDADDPVIVVRASGQVKVYPQDIMDWHEIVNDGPADAPFTLSYCPLTASSVAWAGNPADADDSYGVSGLLFNSNLLLYDRQTDSIWSQMLQRSVNGERIGQRAENLPLFEAPFGTVQSMYPDALVLNRDTGHVRDYDSDPYSDYRKSEELLFPTNRRDSRLHPKERLIGIHDDNASKVYQLSEFGDTTQAINDQFGGQAIVVVGNSALGFAAIFSRELADGTILSFDPVQDDLPNVLVDTEGNVWDLFGTAVAGPRAGEQLRITQSYVAMWFAWVAQFIEVRLYFNPA